jgi:hypothetical protein
MSSLQRCPRVRVAKRPHNSRMRLQPYREMPAREGIPVIGEYALQQRTGALGQQRVLRS